MLTSLRNRGFAFQFNKLQSVGQIPEWICCQLEGNDGVEAESIFCGEDYQLDWEVSPSAEISLVVKGGVQNMDTSESCTLFYVKNLQI